MIGPKSIRIFVAALLATLFIVAGTNNSPLFAQQQTEIAFDELIGLYLLPTGTPQNVLGWDTGSMPGTPISWEHDGVKDCEPYIEKKYGSWACRTGTVVITIQGKPTHTVLARTVQPGRWKITLVGARAGAFYVMIDSNVLSGELGSGLLREAERKTGTGFKLNSIKKCGGVSSGSELMRITAPGKQSALISESWSCGSGGCSVDYVLTSPLDSKDQNVQKLISETCLATTPK
jgi:hypothetical protein